MDKEQLKKIAINFIDSLNNATLKMTCNSVEVDCNCSEACGWKHFEPSSVKELRIMSFEEGD
jgi:hypothetical protein